MSMVPAFVGEARDCVILLHGIGRTARSLRKMEIALQSSRFTTLNLDYASRRKPLGELADDIDPVIKRFIGDARAVHFVCHSMGGLLARVYVGKYRPRQLGRVVMLGAPNGGSEIADRLSRYRAYRMVFGPAGQQLGTRRTAAVQALLPRVDYPVGIIAGSRSVYPISGMWLPKPHDGRVSVKNTELEGMTDHIVLPVAHPWLPRDGRVIEQTRAFLQTGQFLRTAR